jgi:hypothetical protein
MNVNILPPSLSLARERERRRGVDRRDRVREGNIELIKTEGVRTTTRDANHVSVTFTK